MDRGSHCTGTAPSEQSYSRLVQVSNYPPQTPFNRGEIQRDRDNLVNFFRQQGFFQAEVDPEVKLDTTHGLANITFNTTLNKKAKFGNVVITGTTPEQAESLAENLRGLRARIRGAAIRPGKTYRYSNVTNANKFLQSRLESKTGLPQKYSRMERSTTQTPIAQTFTLM